MPRCLVELLEVEDKTAAHENATRALYHLSVNADNQLRGMISLDDLDVPEDEFLRNLILIEDMVVDNVSPLDPEDNLHEALQRLLDSGYDKLPVVETAADGEESFRGSASSAIRPSSWSPEGSGGAARPLPPGGT